jgi:hypothetical protein
MTSIVTMIPSWILTMVTMVTRSIDTPYSISMHLQDDEIVSKTKRYVEVGISRTHVVMPLRHFCYSLLEGLTITASYSMRIIRSGVTFPPWKSKTWIFMDFLSKTRLAADLLGVFLKLILGSCFRLD